MRASYLVASRRARTMFVCAVLLSPWFLSGCDKEPGPDATLQQYLADWSKQDYQGMYQLLSADAQSKITEADFINRYKVIGSGVGLMQLQNKFQLPSDFKAKGDTAQLAFQATWSTTVVGNVNEAYQVKLSKEKDGWRINWTPELIFPGLKDGWKVRVTTTPASRGEIVDRNGIPLVQDEMGYAVGLVPGKMKNTSSADFAKALHVSETEVQKQLNQSWVKPDLFVPFKNVFKATDAELVNQLLTIPGVQVQPSAKPVRVYPQGPLAAQTIGYVGPITADELTPDAVKKGYQSNDIIGKQGIEAACEPWLRGTPGGEIDLMDGAGNKQEVIAHRNPVQGDTVQLTLDTRVQKAFEHAMAGEVGGAAVLDPANGEVLALASLPSFNPYQLSSGVSVDQWNQLISNSGTPLVNHALSAVPPGSSIKPIVASIALDNQAITPTTQFPTDPVKWQKDASWGSYFVTRVGHPASNPDLLNALVWSDNVYFAQVGLKLGGNAFLAGMNKWGLGQKFPFDLTVVRGQVSQDGHLAGEPQLADSAYGQGQMLVSPLQLVSMFSAFLHDGDEVQPYLIDSIKDANGNAVKEGNPQMVAKGVVSPGTAKIIRDDLREVVASPSGTGHGISDLAGWSVSGKTGTAQVQGGKNGSEWGWFTAWAGRTGSAPQYLISMVLANVQNEEESHTTVACVKAALVDLSR